MKLTEKAKRYLLVLGGILLCAGLLVAIWFQLKPEAVPEEPEHLLMRLLLCLSLIHI